MVSAGCASAGGHEWAATALWLWGWSADTKIAADIFLKLIPSTWRKVLRRKHLQTMQIMTLSLISACFGLYNYPGSHAHLPRWLLGLTSPPSSFCKRWTLGSFSNSNLLLWILSNDLKSSAFIDLKKSSHKHAGDPTSKVNRKHLSSLPLRSPHLWPPFIHVIWPRQSFGENNFRWNCHFKYVGILYIVIEDQIYSKCNMFVQRCCLGVWNTIDFEKAGEHQLDDLGPSPLVWFPKSQLVSQISSILHSVWGR